MSNVLLVDTNFSSGPIYRFLIQAGHNVTVVGSNPKDALAKSVGNYVQLDYSDVEKTRQLVENRNIDYLVPGCNDRSYMVCAEINQDGHFPGIDPLRTADIINNKEKFRRFSAEQNLPVPQLLSEQEIGTRWPIIVKPVDAFSGQGVKIIQKNNEQELPVALEVARQKSRTGACIVEDFVDGQLYSHSAFIHNGRIIFDHVVEEHGIVNAFVVDTSRVLYDFPEEMLESIRKDINLIANKLTLRDGLIHTQFISSGSQYWLIEITRRCPGDLYSQLIELSTGLNYAENYARPFVGMPYKFQQNSYHKWVMRHTLTQSNAYILGSLEFKRPLNLIKWIPISLTGDRLRESPNSRIAIMFAEESDEQALDGVFQATLKRQLYAVNA
jgi:formate-dependent phosphoribosylglycinamide formyltransferase (GAR transformylase)